MAKKIIKGFLGAFVPLSACWAGCHHKGTTKVQAAGPRTGNLSSKSSLQLKALQEVIELCKDSKVTRLVIEQHGQRILTEGLDPRGRERLDTMSVTKAIGGLVAGIFMDREKIVASDYFTPEVVRKESSGAEIKIEHVLTHSSGLRLPEADQVTLLYQADDFARLFDGANLLFQPGSRTEYSNLAVNLLSLLIQSVTGQTMANYADSVLFQPLGIDGVFWESDGADHSFVMAGLHLRADDLVKISSLLFSRGTYQGTTVVPPEWIEALWQGSRFIVDDAVGARVSWQNLWAQTYYEVPSLNPKTNLPWAAPDILSANGYGGQYIIACKKSQLQIITQRDMDLEGVAPPLGGSEFLEAIRRLDTAFEDQRANF